MQFTCNAKPGHQLRARLGHTIPDRAPGKFIERARSVRHNENFKVLFQRGKSRKSSANFSDNTINDGLFFLPVVLAALPKYSLFHALMFPGRAM